MLVVFAFLVNCLCKYRIISHLNLVLKKSIQNTSSIYLFNLLLYLNMKKFLSIRFSLFIHTYICYRQKYFVVYQSCTVACWK